MRQQGGVRLPAQAGLVASVAQVIQDTSVLSGISGTKAGSLKLGDLAGFGDADVRRKIETRKHDAPQYEDLLVEFYVAAWYLSEGCQVTPTERDGLADLRVDHPDHTVPRFIECKRLSTASPKRVGKTICKANKQIKCAAAEVEGDFSGIVILDVSAVVGVEVASSEGGSQGCPRGRTGCSKCAASRAEPLSSPSTDRVELPQAEWQLGISGPWCDAEWPVR